MWEQRAGTLLLTIALTLGSVPLPARADDHGEPGAPDVVESSLQEESAGMLEDVDAAPDGDRESPETSEEGDEAADIIDMTNDAASAIEDGDEAPSLDDEASIVVDAPEADALEQSLADAAEGDAVEEVDNDSDERASAQVEETPREAVEEVEASTNATRGKDDSEEEGLAAMAASKKRDISKATVAKIAKQAYTGAVLRPSPTVKWKGKRLTAGKDYELSYVNNITAGKATIVIRGRGSYTGTLRTHFTIVAPSVAYYSHVEKSGWEHPWINTDGFVSGTSGQSRRVEAVRIKLAKKPVSGSICYRAHVQGTGWEDTWKSNGALSGTTGQGKRLEAIQIKLTGKMAKKYDVHYRVHAQHFGWMAWTMNGKSAGSQGFAYRLEALQIRVVPKGTRLPTSASRSVAFVQYQPSGKTGWQNPSEYPQVSPNSVTLPSYCTGYHTYVTPSRIAANATRAQCVEAFIARAYEYLGTPYREPWAREPGVACDCSGLVLQCLYATGMDLEHARGTDKVGGYNPYNHFWVPEQTSNSMRWYENNTFMPVSLSEVMRGDLIYYPGHVVIYLGNGRIIDTVAGRGCAITKYDAKGAVGAQRPFV